MQVLIKTDEVMIMVIITEQKQRWINYNSGDSNTNNDNNNCGENMINVQYMFSYGTAR